MRKILATCLIIASLLFVSNVHADLEGDTITYEYLFPDFDTALDFQSIVVEPGTGDEVSTVVGFEPNFLFVNPEPNSIELFFDTPTIFGTGSFIDSEFNGVRFSDLDFAGGAFLQDVILTTDFVGLDESRLSFGDDFVQIDFATLPISSPTSSISLELVTVPEPGAFMLLAIGCAGLLNRRSRKI